MVLLLLKGTIRGEEKEVKLFDLDVSSPFRATKLVIRSWQRLFSRFFKISQAKFLGLACRKCAIFETRKMGAFYLQSWGCVKLRVQGAKFAIFRKINCKNCNFLQICANFVPQPLLVVFCAKIALTFLQKLAVTWRVGVSNIVKTMETRCRDSIKWSFLYRNFSWKSVPVLLQFRAEVSVF